MEKGKVSEKDLNNYIEMVQGKVDKYFERFEFLSPETIKATIGKKFAKVIKVGSQKSVHTFINMENGDILKAGTWKAPQANGVRGNIFASDNGANVVNEHGAVYLR